MYIRLRLYIPLNASYINIKITDSCGAADAEGGREKHIKQTSEMYLCAPFPKRTHKSNNRRSWSEGKKTINICIYALYINRSVRRHERSLNRVLCPFCADSSTRKFMRLIWHFICHKGLCLPLRYHKEHFVVSFSLYLYLSLCSSLSLFLFYVLFWHFSHTLIRDICIVYVMFAQATMPKVNKESFIISFVFACAHVLWFDCPCDVRWRWKRRRVVMRVCIRCEAWIVRSTTMLILIIIINIYIHSLWVCLLDYSFHLFIHIETEMKRIHNKD